MIGGGLAIVAGSAGARRLANLFLADGRAAGFAHQAVIRRTRRVAMLLNSRLGTLGLIGAQRVPVRADRPGLRRVGRRSAREHQRGREHGQHHQRDKQGPRRKALNQWGYASTLSCARIGRPGRTGVGNRGGGSFHGSGPPWRFAADIRLYRLHPKLGKDATTA